MSNSAAPTLFGSSAVMAAGTVVSRISGYARNILLAAALGTGLHADVFNIANTIPNMLYILLAGGVFNAVLVPQLVRARKDPDGGDAYTSRMITLAAVFLLVVSVVLVVIAPDLMRLFLDGRFFTPSHTPQRDAAIAFARYCLPQVFFYGMFVLVGQVLNARGSFGPMMWAPIANNIIAVAVLIAYLAELGPAKGAGLCGGYSTGATTLLGLGSTVGIAAQLLVLVPYLRKAGYRFRPRFDFRGAGLGHTLRLGVWTVLFVVVNQIAFTVTVRLASRGTIATNGCAQRVTHETGYTVFSYAYTLIMVPHSVVTVSLATALLPQLSAYAAERNVAGLGTAIGSAVRSVYALMLPLLVLVPVLAVDVSVLAFGYGASRATAGDFAPSLSLFAISQLFFTMHYLVLRGFYALEQTRRTFWIQCVVSGTNIALAILLTRGIPAVDTSPRLVAAYGGSYVVGATLSYLLLSRELGGLASRRLVRFLVRLALATAVATLVAWLCRVGMADLVGSTAKSSLAITVVVAGLVDVAVFWLMARALRIHEVTDVVGMLLRRIRPS